MGQGAGDAELPLLRAGSEADPEQWGRMQTITPASLTLPPGRLPPHPMAPLLPGARLHPSAGHSLPASAGKTPWHSHFPALIQPSCAPNPPVRPPGDGQGGGSCPQPPGHHRGLHSHSGSRRTPGTGGDSLQPPGGGDSGGEWQQFVLRHPTLYRLTIKLISATPAAQPSAIGRLQTGAEQRQSPRGWREGERPSAPPRYLPIYRHREPQLFRGEAPPREPANPGPAGSEPRERVSAPRRRGEPPRAAAGPGRAGPHARRDPRTHPRPLPVAGGPPGLH